MARFETLSIRALGTSTSYATVLPASAKGNKDQVIALLSDRKGVVTTVQGSGYQPGAQQNTFFFTSFATYDELRHLWNADL